MNNNISIALLTMAFLLIVTSTVVADQKITLEKLDPIQILPLGDYDVYFKTTPFLGIDFNGNIYAADNNRSIVYKTDKNGKLLKKVGGPGHGPGELRYPRHILIAQKNILVVDTQAVSRFDLNGKYINRFRVFGAVHSMAVFQEKVLLLQPEISTGLITIFDFEGKQLSSFGEKYKLNYSNYINIPPQIVDRLIYRGKIVSDTKNIYYISYFFGSIFKYDSTYKLIFKKELDINLAKENKKLFLGKGRKKKEELSLHRRIFNDALLVGTKVYLLLFKPGVKGEIWQLDSNLLNLEKKYSYYNQISENGDFISRSFAVAREENNIQFFISVYDDNLGDVFILEYKKGGKK